MEIKASSRIRRSSVSIGDDPSSAAARLRQELSGGEDMALVGVFFDRASGGGRYSVRDSLPSELDGIPFIACSSAGEFGSDGYR